MERITIKKIGERVAEAIEKILKETNMAGAPLSKTAAEIAKLQQSKHKHKNQS